MSLRWILLLAFVSAADAGAIAPATKDLLYPKLVTAFYVNHENQNVWSDPKLVQQLEEAIAEAALHGLRPEDYRFTALEQETDLFLTDAFFAYAHDLRFGRASHRLKGQDWQITHNDLELLPLLDNALSTGKVHEQLATLAPSTDAYRSLQNALLQYRQIASSGGWPTVKSPEDFELLQRRLETTQDYLPNMEMTDALMRFQQRHGLRVDGIVGKQTIAALNMSVQQRISQIELSLERMRWMPREFPDRFVVVNVPGFDLRVFEQGRTVQIMRVIVGKTTWCTPTFLSSEINQIIVNPAWYVPSIIASKEIYPLLKKDPGYLKRNNIRMISRADGSVQLRQSPGPHNSLGRIKFLFPNCCDCYLHDTPDKQLFDQVLRLFSHGCIRIEKAFDLGAWILRDEGWSQEKLASLIESKKTQTIHLAKPTAIFIVYFTTWVEEDGSVQFRGDVYGKDKELYGR